MPSLPFDLGARGGRPNVTLNVGSDFAPLVQDLAARGFTPRAIQDTLAQFDGLPAAEVMSRLGVGPRASVDPVDVMSRLQGLRGAMQDGAPVAQLAERVADLERLIHSADIGGLAAELQHLRQIVAGLGMGGYGRSYAQGEPRSVTDTFVNGDTTSVFGFGNVSFPNGFDMELTNALEVSGGQFMTIANMTVAGKAIPFLTGTGVNAFRSSAAGRQIVTYPAPVVGDLTITLDVTAPSANTCSGTLTLWSRAASGTGRVGPNS